MLCKSNQKSTVWERLRYDEKGTVVQCENCGLVRLEGAYKIDSDDFYVEEYASQYFEGSKRKMDELFNRFFPIQQGKIDRISPYLKAEHHVLEIGSSVGYTLKAVEPHVQDVIGIELNREHAEYASDIKGIKTYSTALQQAQFQRESFDHVFLFQVLEHIPDPISFLADVYSVLKPEGYLHIEVPTLQNPLVSLYSIKEFKDFWFQKPHLYYFSEETLAKTIRKSEFRINEMCPVIEVSFLNHINWMLRKKPMVSRKDCMDSRLPTTEDVEHTEVLNEINAVFSEFDNEYKKILEKARYGDLIYCVCRK